MLRGRDMGAEFHPGLARADGPVIRKGPGGEDGYSAFTTADPQSGETVPTGVPPTATAP